MNTEHSGHGAISTAASSAPTGAATFTCPMHPEIKRPEAGSCPICGMTLVDAGGEQV